MKTLLSILMLTANVHSLAQLNQANEEAQEDQNNQLFQDEYRREEIIIKEIDPEKQQEDIRNYRYDVPPKGRELDEKKAQEE